MPGSIEILCHIQYTVKQGCVRPHDALTCISQVIFTIMVSRTADLAAVRKHSQRLLLIDSVRAS